MPRKSDSAVTRAYASARDRYLEMGVDTEAALRSLAKKAISIHCWQGDDVAGFENPSAGLTGGGIQTTGNYPGRARTPEELRSDIDTSLRLIPGRHRVNIHAIYGEFDGRAVDRNAIETKHFQAWIDWAKKRELGLDFNGSFFSHPRAADGFTLSSKNRSDRRFWVEHAKQCRKIAADMGRALGTPSVHNLWIPDGMKDFCVDRLMFRAMLKDSLDEIYSVKYSPRYLRDSVEPKLFGIGSESFVVGSHEFYLAYALQNGLMPCFDLGHFHPTESVADKISSTLLFSEEILLHVSRGVRWDSDHVAIFDDTLREVAAEIVRCAALDRVTLALDYFDASLNRVGAWVIGARATLKALLSALLSPTDSLRSFESLKNYFGRLALLEEQKTLPFGAVWDYYCLKNEVPPGESWIADVMDYEKEVLSKRG